MAPFAGEGRAVEGWDVEDEEVAGAGHVELWWGSAVGSHDSALLRKVPTWSSRNPYIAKRLPKISEQSSFVSG